VPTDVDAPAIGDYAFLGDANGAALVSRAGSIDWACLPRFDAPSTFARILDPAAGHWSLAPLHTAIDGRRYLDGTLVLETTHRGDDGVAVVTDALALGAGEEGHELGTRAPHLLLRRVACTAGWVRIRSELRLRPEYGLAIPVVAPEPGGARCRGGSIDYALSSAAPLTDGDGALVTEVELGTGKAVIFGLQTCDPGDEPPLRGPAELDELLAATIRTWRSWSALHRDYEGPYPAEVAHSSRVLIALTYAPSGAMVAAPTTSLPEVIGGDRNWDYRYCWVRDASVMLQAMSIGTCRAEALRFLEFVATAGVENGCETPTPVVYGIRGERLLAEAELDHLAGHHGSRPVRIGNGAWRQRQNDAAGSIIDAAHRLAGDEDDGEVLTPRIRAMLVRLADAAAADWRTPDHGIWELRGPPRHYLSSKLMSWVGLDRAIELAPRLGADDRVADWSAEREQVRVAILEQGWSDQAGAYTQSFGSATLDAAALELGLTGFLPWDDERLQATIRAVREHLTDADGFVYRFRDDGGTTEGSFILCSYWLVRCLACSGEQEAATALFERILARANDVGLLSEELAPDGAGLLGNFPQAYSHLGLITAAATLGETAPVSARRR
jgi:GH15 family glucan-1,4-alpha-glucosidase